MRALFLRFYLRLAAAMVLGVLAFMAVVNPMNTAQMLRSIEATFSVPLGVLREVLADDFASGRDAQATLERASGRLAAPIALVPRESLSLAPPDRERLERGEIVRSGDPRLSVFHATVRGSALVLEVGPIATPRPITGPRTLVLLLLFLGALFFGVYLQLGPVRRRLEHLTATAHALGQGKLDARAELGDRDAFGEMAATFNAMAAQIQQLVAAQREVLHVTSHELRTPIQRLHFVLERISAAETRAEREQVIERAAQELDEMDDLIEELLTYVRLGTQRTHARAPLDLRRLVAQLCEQLAAEGEGVTLAGPLPDGEALPVLADGKLLRRALSNLVTNARRHARSRVEVHLAREGWRAQAQVDDDGGGVPPEEREAIFLPFHRRDDEQTQNARGFGLGLAIVRRIAETHGGAVAVAESPLGGARFTFSLPIEGEGAPPPTLDL